MDPLIQRFSGGMNLFGEDIFLDETEYGTAFNIRIRSGAPTPTHNKILDAAAPSGKKQGLLGFDQYLVLFVAGKAYYRRHSDIVWTQVSGGFQLDASVERIYTQAIPASTFNFTRKLNNADEDFFGSPVDTKILPSLTTNSGSPAGLLCQDGINQAWIIFPDGTSRVTKTYAQWTTTDREYVPIGKQMTILHGKLFVANGREIYHSVSGRYLDFVVNVDENADKGGDATTVAHSVSYNLISALIATRLGNIVVGTTKESHIVELDYDNLMFNEPRFRNVKAFAANIVGQTAFVEALDDYVFIDNNGLRSFEAIKALGSEGENAIFSLKVSKLFSEGIRQIDDKATAEAFDNYVLFAVNTIYGYQILVYDVISEIWVCLDTIDLPVKQFAVVNQSDAKKLFCIASDSVYELYAESAPYNLAIVTSRGFSTNNPYFESKASTYNAVFFESDTDTEVSVTEYVDNQKGKKVTLPLQDTRGGISYPAEYPVMYDSSSRMSNLNFNFGGIASIGYKLNAVIRWDNGSKLISFMLNGDLQRKPTSDKQQGLSYSNLNN